MNPLRTPSAPPGGYFPSSKETVAPWFITKSTAGKAIDALCKAGILGETTGRQRDRVYAYRTYLKLLAEDTTIPADGG